MKWMLGIVTLSLCAFAPLSEAAGPQIHLKTAYLQQAVDGARQISIQGQLGGTGQLQLDPNTCGVNQFGDTTVCTRMAPRLVKVELKQAKLADPTGHGRRLFLISGMPGPAKYFLVVPKNRSGIHRLVIQTGNAHRAITLEPQATGKGRPADKPLCRNVAYRAEQRGDKVTITAAGNHRSAGWQAHFEDLPIRIWPPQFKLVCIPPSGMAAQVIVPYEVRRTFVANQPVSKVVVHDGNGKHEIAVAQVK